MAKKLKGFSLAEVLITLLVVGIVGAAAIPTMTKRSTGTDKMWDWADYPVGSAYSVGTHVLLNASETDANVIQDGLTPAEYLPNIDSTLASAVMPTGSPPVSPPAYDKLILMNNFNIEGLDEDSRFAKPHISFYNKYRSGLNSVTDYAGSLTADRTNLALGIGSLQRLVPTATGGLFNTAVGHYALLNNKYGVNNTALGNGAMASLGYDRHEIDDEQGWYNVAIGAEALSNDIDHDLNTAVGYSAMTGVTIDGGIRNVAVGANALGTDDPDNKFFQSENIAIGANAGYNKGTSSTAQLSGDNNFRLFIGENDGTTPALFEATMTNNDTHPIPNPLFNINADELIVNTADGKHTILKINMVDYPVDASGKCDDCPSLPELGDSGYSSLGYCVGEGTDDLARFAANDKDATALADVCIAKFSNNVFVGMEDLVYSGADETSTLLGKIAKFFKKIISNANYAVKEPSESTYADWDIYLKGLDIGIYGFTSTTLTNDRVHIQTVKASLNYLDTWKEGMGILSSAMQAFTDNFICFFDFFDAAESCENYQTEGKPYTFAEYIKDKIESILKSFSGFSLDSVAEFFNGIGDKMQEKKEQRIQNWQNKMNAECPNKKLDSTKRACYNYYQGLINAASDRRLKNVEGKSVAGLKEINALKIKNYTYKADKAQTPHVGVIAQELQQVFPNSVFEGPNGYLKIKQEEMFFAMVNAIKELDEQSIELKGEIPKVNKQIKTTVDKNKKLLTKNEKLKLENEKLMAQLKELEK